MVTPEQHVYLKVSCGVLLTLTAADMYPVCLARGETVLGSFR